VPKCGVDKMLWGFKSCLETDLNNENW
jgi:hypothetical protein